MKNKRLKVDFQQEGNSPLACSLSAPFQALPESTISILPPAANVRFLPAFSATNRSKGDPQRGCLPGSARFQRAFLKAGYLKGTGQSYCCEIHNNPGSRCSFSARKPDRRLSIPIVRVVTNLFAYAVHTLDNSVTWNAEARVPNFAGAVAKPLINSGAATPVSSDSTTHVSSYSAGYRITFPTTVSNACTE